MILNPADFADVLCQRSIWNPRKHSLVVRRYAYGMLKFGVLIAMRSKIMGYVDTPALTAHDDGLPR